MTVSSILRSTPAFSATSRSGRAPTAQPAPPSDGRAVALDRTLRAWVDAARGGHMKRKEFERSLNDWQTAGMCTTEQAHAARAAVDGAA